MRKVVIHKAGGHERLQIEESETPRPGAGEVLIEVEAAGVNYADVIVRLGLYSSAKLYVGWPITPGFEVAGRVAALGEGAAGLAVGDEVMAVTRFGGYTSHLVAPRSQVFPRPAGFSAAEAAAFPSVYLTAWYALFECAHVRPGERILVHSAAGGVGGALCRLGSIAGCEVTGVVGGPHKVEVARAAGAMHVVDRSAEDLWPAAERASPAGFEVVLDANGPSTLRDSYNHLAQSGRLVVYGFASMFPRGGAGGRLKPLKLLMGWLRTPRFDPLRLTQENRSVLAFNLSYLFERAEVLSSGMERLLGWVGEGKIEAPPVRTFPLEDVADAHKAIESGTSVGKLVLLP